MAVELFRAIKPKTNHGRYDKAQSYVPADCKKKPEGPHPFPGCWFVGFNRLHYTVRFLLNQDDVLARLTFFSEKRIPKRRYSQASCSYTETLCLAISLLAEEPSEISVKIPEEAV